MNRYTSLQRKDQRWDYTCGNRRTGTYPVGYCAGYHEMTEADAARVGLPLTYFTAHNERMREHKAKYHDDGHATAAEAEVCYRDYLLDFDMTIIEDDPKATTLHKCLECEAFTSGSVRVHHGSDYDLCKSHRTREVVARHFTSVGSSWSSF